MREQGQSRPCVRHRKVLNSHSLLTGGPPSEGGATTDGVCVIPLELYPHITGVTLVPDYRLTCLTCLALRAQAPSSSPSPRCFWERQGVPGCWAGTQQRSVPRLGLGSSCQPSPHWWQERWVRQQLGAASTPAWRPHFPLGPTSVGPCPGADVMLGPP